MAQSSPLPVDATGLTPAWVEQALEQRHPGVRVASVSVLGENQETNYHVRIGVTYDDPSGAPDSLFCKLPPLDPAHRQAIGATGMGAREARFYSDLASSVSMRIPATHFAAADADGGFVLLLEDLTVTGCRISDGSWAIPADLAAGALRDLAEMHVGFEDPDRLAEVSPWAATTRSAAAAEFTTSMLRHVIDGNRDVLSDAYIAVAELYIEQHAGIDALWQSGPQTLIHGDVHIGNLFIDDGRVGFLDWGLLNVMTPMRDVSYFLTMGMDTDERRGSERQLLQGYLDARRRLGGSEITFDDAWRAHRIHTGYTVLASFLSLVPPYNKPERQMFSSNFRNRSIAALDDLDTLGALRDALA